MTNYVIIGHGVAGTTAAEKIRALDRTGTITIFSREPQPFYYRVRLPEVVSGQVGEKQVTIHPFDWYEKNQIELLLGQSAASVDPEARQVTGDNGRQVGYDLLLMATGARCFVPPVPGAQLPGVFSLRTFADARAIAAQAAATREAVLVGGGLLGLEAGAALLKLGLQVQVVEFFDRLLPRQMDVAGAAKLQKRLETMGFTFFLDAKTKAVVGDGQASGLILADGRTISGGLVLFSAGIRPNLDLARAVGLEVGQGLKVDDYLHTSRPEIYAAGDLIEHRGRMYGIWPAAREQGLVAGTNMAGGTAQYQGTVMANALKVVGLDLTSAGNIDAEGKLEAAIFEDEGTYRKIVLDQGRIVGFIFFGLTAGVKECQAALAKSMEVGGLASAMTERDFDFRRLG